MFALLKLLVLFMCSPEIKGKVVGQIDCKLNDVVKTLQNLNTINVLGDKLSLLAIQLDLALTDLNLITKKEFDGNVLLKFHKVLECWIAKSSAIAYLRTLINALRMLDLNEAADLLSEQFDAHNLSNSDFFDSRNKNSGNKSDTSDKSILSTSAGIQFASAMSDIKNEVSCSAITENNDSFRTNVATCMLPKPFDTQTSADEEFVDTSMTNSETSTHDMNTFNTDLSMDSSGVDQPNDPGSKKENKIHSIYDTWCFQIRAFNSSKAKITAAVIAAVITFLSVLTLLIIFLVVLKSAGENHIANGEPIYHASPRSVSNNGTTSTYNKMGLKKYFQSLNDLESETENFINNRISSFEITLENSTLFSVAFNAYTFNGFFSGNITFVYFYTFMSKVENYLTNLSILAKEPLADYQMPTNLQMYPILSLPRLQAVYLQNLYPGDDIYSFITDRIVATNLKSFTSIVVDDMESLKDVDTCSSTYIDDRYPTTSFCQRFPNVNTFVSNVGKVSTKILQQTGCSHMKHIMINLANCKPNEYSDNSLQNRFQELKWANITIFSLLCENTLLQSEGMRKVNNVIFNISIECPHIS